MASIKDMLGTGQSALTAHQRRMATIQNNVANASTEGYRRKRNDLVTVGGQTQQSSLYGVRAREQSAPQTFTSRQRSLKRGEANYSTARASALVNFQAVAFPVEGGEIEVSMREFFSSARALEAAPADAALRQDFLSGAEQLAASFRGASGAITREREALASEISTRVSQLNDKLAAIASLDEQIATSDRASALDLVDQRDQLAQEVGAELGAEVFEREDGSVSVITRSGRALVEGKRARPLSVERQGDQITVLLGGGAAEPAPLSPLGGRIGGLVDSHNQDLNDVEARLDALAFDFANAANAAHSAGFAPDGTGGRALFGGVAAQDGAARAIALSADVAGQPENLGLAATAAATPGGNGALQQLLGLRDVALAGSGAPPEQTLSGITTGLASQISSLRADADVAATAMNYLDGVEASVTGVSLEEEMIAMTESQNALQASLKLINASQEMFDAILSIKA